MPDPGISEREQRKKRRKAKRRVERLRMKQEIKELQKIVKEICEAAEKIRKDDKRKFREQKIAMKQYEENLNRANLLLETTVRTTLLPIIAAIVYKKIYRIGFTQYPQEHRGGGDRRGGFLSDVQNFEKFGMKSSEEMQIFASTVSTIRH